MDYTDSQLEEIVLYIYHGKPQSKADFDMLRRSISSDLGLNQPPNRTLLKAYQKMVKKGRLEADKQFKKLFQKAGIRSHSGIAVVTSLLKPYTCPGKCIYCPTEVKMPKSYIASEPAAARSLRLDFNPYELMKQRIEMLESNGHPADKIEYITKGGTWNAYPLRYQYWYIMESFKACNNFSRKKKIKSTKEEYWNDKTLDELIEATLVEQEYNETSTHRIIGITLETRPDAINPKTIYHMRQQGCTRVELGLQAPDDKILDLVKRGHTVDQFRKAILLLRMAGFKVDLHFMPDLPGTTPEHDVEMYKMLFDDPSLSPDMVKIYPNTVIESAELYQWFLDGRYKSYGGKALFDALLEMKKVTPRYCRISRLIRDIPSDEIKDGNTITNLRELLKTHLLKRGDECVCLRCREIARQQKNLKNPDAEPEIFVDTYETVGGTEYFITFEDPDRIAVYGFIRLRIPHAAKEKDKWVLETTDEKVQKQMDRYFPELEGCAFIRELHVYGQLIKIGKKDNEASQHRGFGKKLVAKAEEISKENGFRKLAVISGVGVRGYYKKLGYKDRGTYVIKDL